MYEVGALLDAGSENLEQSSGDDRTLALVGAAHQNAKDTLAELRDLARGIHPPVLAQRPENVMARPACHRRDTPDEGVSACPSYVPRSSS